MAETHWDPVRELMALQHRLNRLIDQSLGRSRSQAGVAEGGTWSPAVDLYESDRAVVLQAELPGVDQADIQLSIDDNRLTLRGERRQREPLKDRQFVRTERMYGPFRRTFTLPGSIDPEGVRAEFKKGVLRVVIPKRVDEATRRIPIQS